MATPPPASGSRRLLAPLLVVLATLVIAFGLLALAIGALGSGAFIAAGGILLALAGRALARAARTGVVVGYACLGLALVTWGLGGIYSLPWSPILLVGGVIALARRRRKPVPG